jgi:16S rRNA C967 or C1407 C5-methylase (RsmB/RsmF family)
LKENTEFSTEPLELPEIFGENRSGMLALVPGQYETDGFFICRMRRKA